MRAIGIDPGYDRMGVAILEQGEGRERVVYSTCILTDKTLPIPDRLSALGERFEEILREYTPNIAGLETLFFTSNQKTAMAVAEARGIAVFLARRHGAVISEFPPQTIKVAVTGYGKSDKQAVTAMLPRLLDNVPQKALDDEYDAIAIALTCLAHHR